MTEHFTRFQEDFDVLPAPMSELLTKYSNIPPEQQKEHIIAVRNRAYASHPYPCLGRWRFLELDVSSHPLYRSYILPSMARAKPDSEKLSWTYLDLGCCIGQDIRKVLFDGADPSRVLGADLRPEFIDIGYELFRDENKFPKSEHFVAPADIFDFSTESELSKKCDGKVGILYSTAVFHLFDRDRQMKMANRCLQLMTKKAGRVLICGSQGGNINPGRREREGSSSFHHNTESWKTMWEEVVQMEPWKDKVKAIDVGGEMANRLFPSLEKEMEAFKKQHNSEGTDLPPEIAGFRWMKWWVWVDFV